MIINSNVPAANILPGAPAPRGKSAANNPADLGADQAQLSSVSSDNLTAAGAPLEDEEAASKSTEMARQMIIAQNAMAMMAQANSMPLNALRLLQQS
jgi:flagellin